jgi:hypothetical protein
MPLAPICILYCKQCMNIIYVGFPGLGFPGEKSLCNVCVCHCIFFILF